eukprot:CAMPEP_0172362366 /NCGR_PEP_ID=MMETSP1060-20121228/5987_1 /TAXON_ID=37318 /ORGANISM="Pseudo-nitzschia pungens, Strain cf. cingulata" /LENGTH=357 /DNA_ID=CAMNT_0013084859 /DNA_START=69 /DNA_END=1142 /DNA_ORIENTATION=+
MLPVSTRATAAAASSILRRTASSSSACTKPNNTNNTTTNNNNNNNNNTNNKPATASVVSTLIFDVDDTLYDVASGFTAHRNGPVIWKYMVDHLGFETQETAKALRDEYFEQYHSTAKALTVAQTEGKFPGGAPVFDAKHMSEYWVNHLDYDLLFGTHAHPTPEESRRAKAAFGKALADCPATLVAFSNGPRSYVTKVLDQLGLLELFGTDRRSKDGALVWGVDDVLPHCKPEAEAFCKIFAKLKERASNHNHNHSNSNSNSNSNNNNNNNNSNEKVLPSECVMVEDSMKNVRAAKALGMKTVLITGSREEGRILPGDAPEADDPAVDLAVATVEEMVERLPGLWKDPPVFDPLPATP